MSEIKTVDVSRISFSSAVFLTDEDMALWHSLSPEEQRAVILRDIEKGLKGPPAQLASKDEIMAEVRYELSRRARSDI